MVIIWSSLHWLRWRNKEIEMLRVTDNPALPRIVQNNHYTVQLPFENFVRAVLSSFSQSWSTIYHIAHPLLEWTTQMRSLQIYSIIITLGYYILLLWMTMIEYIVSWKLLPLGKKATLLPEDITKNEPAYQCRRHKRPRFHHWVGKIP